MSRYAIWDKASQIITPIGEVLTPTQWCERYPVCKTQLKIVCGGGDINGSYFAVFNTMVEMYRNQGCDFTNCSTDQDYLDAIESFEDSQNHQENNGENTAEERIAAALEMQNILAMETVNTDDPDED